MRGRVMKNLCHQTTSIALAVTFLAFPPLASAQYAPCPSGTGPGGITAGDYPPESLAQEQRQWLFEKFGHTGIASVGYGGERCQGSSSPPPSGSGSSSGGGSSNGTSGDSSSGGSSSGGGSSGGGSSGGGTLSGGNSTLTPFIDFRADQTSLSPGQCTYLRWDVENVRAVYLDGAGQIGHSARQVCPNSTTTYTLSIQTHTGSETRTVTITVGGSNGGGTTSGSSSTGGGASSGSNGGNITGTTYTVVRGDSLWKIAQRAGTTVEVLVQLNKDKYPSLSRDAGFLQVGWVLATPNNPVSVSQPSSGASSDSTALVTPAGQFVANRFRVAVSSALQAIQIASQKYGLKAVELADALLSGTQCALDLIPNVQAVLFSMGLPAPPPTVLPYFTDSCTQFFSR